MVGGPWSPAHPGVTLPSLQRPEHLVPVDVKLKTSSLLASKSNQKPAFPFGTVFARPLES
jgi:hypothetical protein